MQLSAPTLPFDPAASLQAGLPAAPSFGAVADENAPTAAFGALLTAETAPLATPAEDAAIAPFVLGQNFPASPVPAAAAPVVPFGLGLKFAPPATPAPALAPTTAAGLVVPAGVLTPESDSSPAAGMAVATTSDEAIQDRPSSTSEENLPEADSFAAWLAANGLSPHLASTPAPVATPESPAAGEAVESAPSPEPTGWTPPTPTAVAQASAPVDSGRPQSIMGEVVGGGEGTAPTVRPAGESMRSVRPARGSQVRAAYSGNQTQRSAKTSARPAASTDSTDSPSSTGVRESAPAETKVEMPVSSTVIPLSAATVPAGVAAPVAEDLPPQSLPQISSPDSSRSPERSSPLTVGLDASSEAAPTYAAPASPLSSRQDNRPEFSARVVRSGDSRSFFTAPVVDVAAATIPLTPAPTASPMTWENAPSSLPVDFVKAAPMLTTEAGSPALSAPTFSAPALPASAFERPATETPLPSASQAGSAEFAMPTASTPTSSPVLALDSSMSAFARTETTPAAAIPTASAPVASQASSPTVADSTLSEVALIGISATTGTPTEKFAADSEDFAEVAATLEKFGIKKSLSADKEEVAKRSAPLGINVAKSSDAMTTLAPTPVRPSTDDTPSTFSVPSLDFAALVKEQPQPSASELASPARRTVESVLAVTDHFTTTGGQHGVNLKFMVSGVELAVRVEVRGGSVQTTFRTDSAELRAALAVQWHAVAATSDERSQRLADPVFTSSSGRDALQSDQGNADQRGARQGQSAPESGAMPRATLRHAPTATVTTASVPVLHSSLSTSGRLHTFA